MKRFDYIDIMRALGIILVIIGHINYANINSNIKVWVYAFHMPLFFVITGMTLKLGKKFNKDSVIKKIKRIYVPYLLWSLIYFSLTPRNIIYTLYGSHQALKTGNSSLWFLPCLFLSCLIMEFIFSMIHKINKYKQLYIYLLIPISIFVFALCQKFINLKLGLPFGLEIVPIAIIFMVLGYLIHQNINKIEQLNKYSKIFVVIVSIMISLTCFCNNVDYVLMAEARFGNLLLFFICSLGGISLIVLFSLWLSHFDNLIKEILKFIGQNTIIIFAVQKPILALCQKILEAISMNIPDVFVIVFYLIVIGIVSFFTIKISNIYLPQLNGNEKV